MNDIWKLRAAAVMWLRYELQCPVVCIERGLGSCIPDVVGVTPKRFMVEIEIKQSMADFRKNAEKWGMKVRVAGKVSTLGSGDYWLHQTLPRQFYFLVPPKLVDKAKAELPAGSGLMSLPGHGADFPQRGATMYGGIPKPIVVVLAPVDKRAEKLSINNVRKMVKHQSGTLSTCLNAISNLAERVVELRTNGASNRTERVRAALKDPDAVAHLAELLKPFSPAEAGTLAHVLASDEGKALVARAHEERQRR